MYDELVKRLREAAEYEPCIMEREDAIKAADAIEELSVVVRAQKAVLDKFPKWIPVTEKLPETGVDVLVKFPQNMAVASIDIGEWVVNSGDGWCTDINLAGGEKNPTYWMPLPEPPKEE